MRVLAVPAVSLDPDEGTAGGVGEPDVHHRRRDPERAPRHARAR